jgi:hypothetical protein
MLGETIEAHGHPPRQTCLLWRIYGWLPREAMDVRRELEMGAPS